MFYARLFRSRWAALFWAAGIVWTAVEIADSAPRRTATGQTVDASGDQINAQDVATVANLIGG